MINSKKVVNGYLQQESWRVAENSNSPFSYGGLSKYVLGEVFKDYWLREVYPEKISRAYVDGLIHIHDLGGLTLYCCGYSLPTIIEKGVRGIPNIPTSSPAKHFGSILNQISNLVTIYQNEIMGAVALNSFDTLLAPFIKKDNLSYEQVYQDMQNFIFSINSNSRGGSEPAFSNLTFDLTPSTDLLDGYPSIAGEYMNFTYKDCQKEINMINKAFFEIMLNGDAKGSAFAYPIPTYNIHDRFDWDNPNNELLWEMAGKYGYPYFANFLNSDLDPSDIRSMCCRLQLDLKELARRNGGLFGSGDSTGSIGVVTINLPRIAYLNKRDKDGFYKLLKKALIISKDSLELKRNWLNKNMLEKNALHAYTEYVGTMNNHFSTIGIVGMNEMCENFFGEDILSDNGKNFCIEVSDYIRDMLLKFQEETGHLYNFEATPAESTCYRLALKDINEFSDIITQGTKEAPYYTNSCHIPVNKVTSIQQMADHQDVLQTKFTGGTVMHLFLNGAISGNNAKDIVQSICRNYKLPYISLSPLIRKCPEHGYVGERVDVCPKCGTPLEFEQKVTGYIRPVKRYNDGKKSEFNDRAQL